MGELLTKLVDSNIGKRMMALVAAGYLITECEDSQQQILIGALAVVYMVCQTVSDWKNKE